uniref:protein-tyrosine-phosphatase n=3 Tax=Nothobranchius TaxID=28779 RepID=A0A1A8PX45_9TELE
MGSADMLLAALLILVSHQAEGYTYRNQRKFSQDIDWSYAGTLNQKNWAKKFPSCSSAKQSPINIEENLAPVKLQYQKLRFDGWESLTSDRTTIKNNGKTVEVCVDGEFYVSGGGLSSKFKVGCITFHWGRCNSSSDGSEHSLDGVTYPLEMQIYCYEAHQFDSLDETIKARGKITALAVLFETSTEDNMDYAAIIDSISSVSRYGKSAEVLPFTMQGLLPNSTEKYFIYNGSLTTPPCSETVEWIVFKNRVAISDEQLEMFCEVMTMQQAGYVMLMDYLQNNYREQQEQFTGQVFSSYTGIEEVLTPVCSSEPESLQAAAYNLSSLLVTWERPRVVYDANIERYSITYRMASAEELVLSEYMTDGYQDTGAILDGLLANTTYEVRVVAICTNGLYGHVSNFLTVVMPTTDAESELDSDLNEFASEETFEPDSSWNELEETINNNLDWSSNAKRTTTPASPFLPFPPIRTESSQRSSTTDPVQHLKPTHSSEALTQSKDRSLRGRASQPPEVLTETRGIAEFGINSIFHTTTATKPFVSTSAASLFTKTDNVHGDVRSTSSSEKSQEDTGAILTIASPFSGNMSTASSPSLIQAKQGSTKATTADGMRATRPRGHSEVGTSTLTVPTSSSGGAKEDTSPSTPTFPSTMTSVPLGAVLLHPTRSLSNGELHSVSPSCSSFSSSALCATSDPSAVPFTSLHEPSSEWLMLSASALDSQHAATPPLSSQDPFSSPVPGLPASTLPPFPHPSSHSLSVWGIDSTYQSVSLGGSDGVWWSGSSVFSSTPPLQTVLVLSGTTTELSGASWDLSLSSSLSPSPTPQPPVLFSSEFTFSEDLTRSVSSGFEDLGYATGGTTEVLLPEASGDGFSLASDVDLMCGCSLEPSTSSTWLHVSLHSPPLSSTWDSSSVELYSSVGLLSTSGVGIDHLLSSPTLVFSPSSSQLLPVTNSDLHISVAATASAAQDFGLSASETNTTSQTTLPPSSPTALPPDPAPESQALDASSTSGSTLFSDLQESIDQEWDRVQTSASGASGLPNATKVTMESGHSPDDVEEHSSAFYFESGSGIIPEVEGVGTPAFSEVTSTTPWSLGGAEESGSGQGESLYDNETSSDFSISEQTEEEPAADASNSSHESRVGSVMEREKKVVLPLAVISTFTLLGLLGLIGILVYWRMCFQTAHFYINNVSSAGVITAQSTPDEETAFPLKDFVKHVAELHSTQGFQREFETLKESYKEVHSCTVDMELTADSSKHPDNKTKNRYSNILAFDHSRVRLSSQAFKDVKTGDYINANYVDGFKRPRSYIATQGPLRSSIEDFWRMIWEQNVSVVVMITNLVENGRRKCDQYWPVEVQEVYGSFLVSVKSTKNLAYYTQRTFTVTKISSKKGSQKGRGSERAVTQFHYTQWPDMGVPEYSLPLLNFIWNSSQARTDGMGPLVVRCSAGVGQTGTYIVLDSMLKQMKDEGTVNITGFLKHIRTQRKDLVQTEAQYVFIHDALVEAILSGETKVTADHLHKYVEELLTPGPAGRTQMEKQFKLVCHSGVQKVDFSAALHELNQNKNRDSSVIPVERTRVRLSTAGGEGSDYINASHIAGYRRRTEYIITQNPLPGTTKDFWRMIWDNNAQVIVSLPGTKEEAEPCVFWPHKEQPITFEMFTVTQRSETHLCLSNEDMLVVREFTLETTQDDYVLEVKQYHAPCWPNPDSPISQTFELIGLVKEESVSKDGPVVVHDDVGGAAAGTFCVLSSLRQQLESEGSVDVFQLARLTNLMRPGVFSDMEHLQFLYKAMLSLVATQEDEKTLQSSDNNGTIVVGATSTTESLESLV